MYALLKKAVSSKNEALAVRLTETMDLSENQKKQLFQLALKHEPKLIPLFISYDDTAAFVACAEAGLIEIVESFLENGMDPNSKTVTRHTLLSSLLFRGKAPFSVIQSLLNHGADIELTDQYDKTSLHFAIGSNQLEAAELMIEQLRRMNPDYVLPDDLLASSPSELRPETVDFVMERGGNVPHKAIFLCLLYENEMALQRLLRYSVSPFTLQGPFNFLSYSLHRGRPSIFERKFFECLPVEIEERKSFCSRLAMAMIDSGYLNLLPLVLEQGIEVNYVDSQSDETLVDVCLLNHEKGWAQRFRDMGGMTFRELHPPEIIPFPK